MTVRTGCENRLDLIAYVSVLCLERVRRVQDQGEDLSSFSGFTCVGHWTTLKATTVHGTPTDMTVYILIKAMPM